MKIAQLIKRTESTLYISNGQVLTLEGDTAKMAHVITGGETKQLVVEEIVERWRIKNKKEVDPMFWNWIEENKVDSRDYYIVIAEN